MRPDRALPTTGSFVTAVVPVKPLGLAKSRLALPTEQRRALALAFALDTVAALSETACVAAIVVVTTDPEVERCLQDQPVELLRETGTGLSAAVRSGCLLAISRWPSAGVLVVPADLPCLSSEAVTTVVGLAPSGECAFVPDRGSGGTTLVLSPPGRTVRAEYGPGSAARHRALGLVSLDDAPVRTRQDVDTIHDLRAAVVLGLGPRSAAQVSSLGQQSLSALSA